MNTPDTAKIQQLKAIKLKLETSLTELEAMFTGFGSDAIESLKKTIADINNEIQQLEEVGSPKWVESVVRLDQLYLSEDLEKSSKEYLLVHYGKVVTLRKSWNKDKIINTILVYAKQKKQLNLTFKVTESV